MRRSPCCAAWVAALTLSACSAGMGMTGPVPIDPAVHAAALADPARPAADRARDTARHAAETLAFAQVRPGQVVGEYMPGAGYFSRLLVRSVGPQGRVYAYVPDEIVKLRAAFLTEANAAAAEPGMTRMTVISRPTPAFAAPEPLDLVFTAQNYHDLYGPFAPAGTGAAFDRAVFAALKPGGAYVVIDHHGVAGSGLSGAGELHRIDRAAAIEAVTAAGFVLEAESDALARADDPRTASVFDPAIRGRTSQFMLRFRKPG